MRAVVVLGAIALVGLFIVALNTPYFASAKNDPIVLGTKDEERWVNLLGQRSRQLVRFDLKHGTFIAMDGRRIVIHWSIQPTERGIVWDFDPEIKGSHPICLCHSRLPDRPGNEYAVHAYRWTGEEFKIYMTYFPLLLGNPDEHSVVYEILNKFVERREQSLKLLKDFVEAHRSGRTTTHFVVLGAYIETEGFQTLYQATFSRELYAFDDPYHIWVGQSPKSQQYVTVRLELKPAGFLVTRVEKGKKI